MKATSHTGTRHWMLGVMFILGLCLGIALGGLFGRWRMNRALPSARTGQQSPAAAVRAAGNASVLQAINLFQYRNQLINPHLINLFVPGYLSDDGGSAIVAVNLAHGYKDSNQFDQDDVKRGKHSAWFRTKDASGATTTDFSYRFFGHLADGTAVIRTACNGGGSGVFMNLLLIRFHLAKANGNLIMTLVRNINLADRYAGKITLRANSIVLGPWHSTEYGQWKRKVIREPAR